LEMSHSTFLKSRVPPELGTTPHLNLPQPQVSPIYPYNRAHAPSSTLHSNGFDMSHWMIANLQKGRYKEQAILHPATYELLWHPYQQTRPETPDRFVGLSWFISKYRGFQTISHAGGDVGFNTCHVLLPELQLGVVVLANTIPAPVEEITHALLDLMLGFEPALPKPPAVVPVWRIYQEQGAQVAAELYRELERSQPESFEFGANTFSLAGFLLLEIQKREQAIEILNFGLSLFPQADALFMMLGLAYMRNEEKERALENLNKCLVLKPDNSFAKKLLDDLLRKEL